MSFEGKRVLVTGATGFLGGRLVERLALEWGAQVRVLVRNLSHAPRVGRFPVEMVVGDAADGQAVSRATQGCDFLFQCAYEAAGTAAEQKAHAVRSAEAVARAALDAKVSRLVHVSSVSVYGSVSAGELTETTPRQPTRHAYALAKRAAEDIMLDFHRRHGLPVAVVQPTVVYGPFAGTWTVQPVLCLKHKRVVLLEGGSGMCNAVYVDDVTDAMRLAAIREEAVGEAFLVTGPDAVHWSEFYAAYERMLDIKSTVPMTLDEVRAHLRQQRKARGTIAQLRRAVHSPKLHKRLRKLPVVAKLTSEEFWESLRKTPAEETEKPLWIPDESNFDLFTSRARVRCDKARQRLGYQPGFDFQRGMELTAKWVAWANLVEAR